MITRLAGAWDRFWFTPQPTSTLALFRIALGLVATVWTATLAPDLLDLFGAGGIHPHGVQHPGVWGLIGPSTHPAVIVAAFLATLVGAVALTVGYRTRLAAVVVFLGILSFQRANTLAFNAGDGLLLKLAFFCMLAPAGASLSLDRLRVAPGRFWEFPERAPWALRLVQVQLSVVYLSAVWSKVQGETWREGTAVSYALRMADIHRFPVPALLTDSILITELLTFGTLALELSLAILVWNRAARPWILGLGIGMHLGIEYSILVGYFSMAMLTAYLAFVPPETASRRILATRDRFRPRTAPVTLPAAPRPGGEPSTNGHRPTLQPAVPAR